MRIRAPIFDDDTLFTPFPHGNEKGARLFREPLVNYCWASLGTFFSFMAQIKAPTHPINVQPKKMLSVRIELNLFFPLATKLGIK